LLGAVAGVVSIVVAVFLYDQIFLVTGDTFAITTSGFLRTYWLLLAVPFGAAFGALGGWWASNRRTNWAGLALAGGAVAGEAAALLVGGLPHDAFRPTVAVGQILIGLGAVLLTSHSATRLKALGMAALVALAIGIIDAITGFPTSIVW
jgi:hypothetical protein